ncbi:MAG: TspO/MBR family protein [Pseudomonadota bacterium]
MAEPASPPSTPKARIPQTRNTGHGWWLLGAYGLATAVASLSGSVFANPDTSAWYQALARPSFQPPSWAFGVVWPILYVLMAYTGWRADKATSNPHTLRVAYALQLAFNAAWTIVFFGLQSPIGGITVIAALLTAIVAWMALASRHDRIAPLLFAPYLAWVGFAGALNGSIIALN